MSKIPVLVTGGAGYVGSHAVLTLVDAGWPVCVVDDLSTGARSVVPSDVPFYEGSVADTDLLIRIVKEQRIGAVMHFAGSIIVPESVEKPLLYYANNSAASLALIAAIVSSGVRHFLFSSTAAVYGAPERVPVKETDPTEPINPYGASKLLTERMLTDCAAAYSFNSCVLRYFNVAGADPDLRSGQIGKDATHLIKVAVETAIGMRDYIEVFGVDYDTPDGTCIRDYIHVTDLAHAHLLALERLIARPTENLLMNCGYGRGLSVLEVLDAVDQVSGRPLVRKIKPRRAGDPAALVASNERLIETLGWRPRYDDIATIVTHALEWEREKGASR